MAPAHPPDPRMPSPRPAFDKSPARRSTTPKRWTQDAQRRPEGPKSIRPLSAPHCDVTAAPDPGGIPVPTISSFASVNAALRNVRDIAATAAKTFVQDRQARADAQAKVNVATTTLARVADVSGPRDVLRFGSDASAQSYNTININAGISKYWVHQPNVSPGQTLDANVDITRSAQVGALLLSFGGSVINLASNANASAGATFVIELTGRRGAQTLSFTSGTSLANVRDAINTFTDGTGVRALVVGGSGIRLESIGFGGEEFVRVRVLNASNALGGGLYQYNADNNNIANPASSVSFNSALNAVTDAGQNIVATINGATAIGQGLELTPIITSGFLGTIRLTAQRAQQLGSFLAFQIIGLPTDNTAPTSSPAGPPSDGPPTYNGAGVVSPRITSKSVDLRV